MCWRNLSWQNSSLIEAVKSGPVIWPVFSRPKPGKPYARIGDLFEPADSLRMPLSLFALGANAGKQFEWELRASRRTFLPSEGRGFPEAPVTSLFDATPARARIPFSVSQADGFAVISKVTANKPIGAIFPLQNVHHSLRHAKWRKERMPFVAGALQSNSQTEGNHA